VSRSSPQFHGLPVCSGLGYVATEPLLSPCHSYRFFSRSTVPALAKSAGRRSRTDGRAANPDGFARASWLRGQ
jgi:hypothetical protein